MLDRFATHDVLNQSPPFADVNLFEADRAFNEAVMREGAEHARARLSSFGCDCGSAAAFERGRLANENLPRLKIFDGRGNRLDIVEFHPAYHDCMTTSMAEGLHCVASEQPANREVVPANGANVVRCAGLYMAAQMEAGHCCPITMTNAAVSTLLLQPDIASTWLPRITSKVYDPNFRPAQEKSSVTIGMGMTEKQGGTDVRSNTTRAEPLSAAAPPEYLITGHKWFMSAPMSDAFLVLAQAPRGLSCFLMPRFRPDGSVNAIRFQRLKDKLGNRSNASAEVEFYGALAWLIGEEGRGVPTMIEMVTATRLDCAVSSAGLMRLALANAIHHARYRVVFQKKLIDQPLMACVLADMALDVEAATRLAFRLAASFDRAHRDQRAAAWRRLMTPVTKYWVCKLAPPLVYEAMECLGGNGYIEEGLLARLYREVPVNAIWEGSGNVMALDVLRVVAREPETIRVVLEDLTASACDETRLKNRIGQICDILDKPDQIESRARVLVETLALLAAATILCTDAPTTVADMFLNTHLSDQGRHTYGQGLSPLEANRIINRAFPG
jgi:putative acyl-CoA dehydrogenase